MITPAGVLNFFLSNAAISISLACISPLRNHAEIAWGLWVWANEILKAADTYSSTYIRSHSSVDATLKNFNRLSTKICFSFVSGSQAYFRISFIGNALNQSFSEGFKEQWSNQSGILIDSTEQRRQRLGNQQMVKPCYIFRHTLSAFHSNRFCHRLHFCNWSAKSNFWIGIRVWINHYLQQHWQIGILALPQPMKSIC